MFTETIDVIKMWLRAQARDKFSRNVTYRADIRTYMSAAFFKEMAEAYNDDAHKRLDTADVAEEARQALLDQIVERYGSPMMFEIFLDKTNHIGAVRTFEHSFANAPFGKYVKSGAIERYYQGVVGGMPDSIYVSCPQGETEKVIFREVSKGHFSLNGGKKTLAQTVFAYWDQPGWVSVETVESALNEAGIDEAEHEMWLDYTSGLLSSADEDEVLKKMALYWKPRNRD